MENLLETNRFEFIEAVDIDRLTKAVIEKYNFNLQNYSASFLNRRIVVSMQKNKISNVNELLNRLNDNTFFNSFISDMSVNGTEFFRDISVWKNIITLLIENFNSNKEFTVWFPNCANGEELYCFMYILKQYGFYDNCKVVASNVSSERIEIIKTGLFEGKNENFDLFNFNKMGFSISESTFFKTIDTAIQLDKKLLQNVEFITTNQTPLVETNTFDLVFSRNIMLFYNKEFQKELEDIIYNSLKEDGKLIIGINEQLINQVVKFKLINIEDKIYQKI